MESPTPWHVGGIGGCRPKLVYDASGRTILRSWGNGSDEENEANVQLAAKAPKLREQVRILREALEGATSDLEDTLSELKLMNPKRQNHNEEARIQRFRTVLEATKEGA